MLRFRAKHWASCLVLTAALAAPHATRAQRLVQPWEGLGQGFAGSFTWPMVMFHVTAAASTPLLAWKVDEPVQHYFQTVNPLGATFGQTMLIGGFIAPIAAPLSVYLVGLGDDNPELATAGSAALQALFVQSVVVSTLKWLTDRTAPFPNGDPTRVHGAHGLLRNSDDPLDFNFNPFDLEGALAWPSGHTASHAAVVSALLGFYPDEIWIGLIGYPVVAAVGLGMIESDNHWLSDVVAGFLIGHAIGWQIGRQFRARFESTRGEASQTRRLATSWLLLPALTHSGGSLTLFVTSP